MTFKVNFDLAVDDITTADEVTNWLRNDRKIDQSLLVIDEVKMSDNGWPNITAEIHTESDLQARYIMSYIYNGDLANPLELGDWANILVKD